MKLGAIRIPCRSLAESEAFYSLLLQREKIFGSCDEGYIGFDLENIQLILEPEEPGEFESGRFLGFSLEVASVDECFRRLQAEGVKFIGAPEVQVWGGVMVHVEDCSQNTFSIVQLGEQE